MVTTAIAHPNTNTMYPIQENWIDNTQNSESSYLQKQEAVKNNSPGQWEELTPEQQQQVRRLKERDREVRAHEMAHIAAAGQYAMGGAQFEYQTGPDGKRYAVGGEVAIDTSEIKNDPQATIQKMQIVKKAALAPAQPSATDRAVATKASQKESKARKELQQQKLEDSQQPASENSDNQKKLTSYRKDGTPIYSDILSHSPKLALFA